MRVRGRRGGWGARFRACGGLGCGGLRLGFLVAADRIVGVLEVARETLEEAGNDGGDGGVVFGGEVAGLTIDLWRDGDGDVADSGHWRGIQRLRWWPRKPLLLLCSERGK